MSRQTCQSSASARLMVTPTRLSCRCGRDGCSPLLGRQNGTLRPFVLKDERPRRVAYCRVTGWAVFDHIEPKITVGHIQPGRHFRNEDEVGNVMAIAAGPWT